MCTTLLKSNAHRSHSIDNRYKKMETRATLHERQVRQVAESIKQPAITIHSRLLSFSDALDPPLTCASHATSRTDFLSVCYLNLSVNELLTNYTRTNISSIYFLYIRA